MGASADPTPTPPPIDPADLRRCTACAEQRFYEDGRYCYACRLWFCRACYVDHLDDDYHQHRVGGGV